jgi:hypothetical protein
MDMGDFLEIYEEAIKLGKERGKQVGDNLDKEFDLRAFYKKGND